MATITGDHVGYPGFWDLGDFSPRRKNFGEQKFARLFASNFHSRIPFPKIEHVILSGEHP
jgi:hypothetical protein